MEELDILGFLKIKIRISTVVLVVLLHFVPWDEVPF